MASSDLGVHPECAARVYAITSAAATAAETTYEAALRDEATAKADYAKRFSPAERFAANFRSTQAVANLTYSGVVEPAIVKREAAKRRIDVVTMAAKLAYADAVDALRIPSPDCTPTERGMSAIRAQLDELGSSGGELSVEKVQAFLARARASAE